MANCFQYILMNFFVFLTKLIVSIQIMFIEMALYFRTCLYSIDTAGEHSQFDTFGDKKKTFNFS